ncbi:ABC transporter ATP-binding protein [Polynucleobacter sp. UB-Tiil-W10]|uniref:ABC transporter ATP-binding protein n=1 Tax=Polynucleobacter sp. UB-Tiil-W10 TaxID=1855648 RepID=UPI001C0E3CF2|nr:ABC transporter ATP-binding protein [Polynucleobacter sp. UB-Tiil-W10]
MLVASLFEVISIGAVLPFLAALTNPDKILHNSLAVPMLNFFDIHARDQILLPFSILFGVAVLFAGVLRLVLIWRSNYLSSAVGMDIGLDIFRRTLFQPYVVHINRNSGELVVGISSGTSNAVYAMTLTVTIVSSLILLLVILMALMSVNPTITFLALGGFGLIYFGIVFMSRRELNENSQVIAKNAKSVVRILQEGLGGIRDVLIDGSQEEYSRVYRLSDEPMRIAMAKSNFISQSPRYVIEAIGMIMIISIAYYLAAKSSDLGEMVLLLGIFALGAQRLLPILQQAYAAWASILGMQASLTETLHLLKQPLPSEHWLTDSERLDFKIGIDLNKIWFRYSASSNWVLKGINLHIDKGDRIGIIGQTGSGKSTLIDIVMGLLRAESGNISVDGNAINSGEELRWQKNISHVPQNIFLSDGSIKSNIAFGEHPKKIDFTRVCAAAKAAQIEDFINGLPEKYETTVGERGVRLSGGQRQRIGIARALYKKSAFIILDEATSALDSDTENAVMQSIQSLSKEITLVIVSHRIQTLKNCNRIFEVRNGELLPS